MTAMCRWLAYSGTPIRLEVLLHSMLGRFEPVEP